MTPTQYQVMQAWARGDFTGDSGTCRRDELLPDALGPGRARGVCGGLSYPGLEANDRILGDATRFVASEPFRLSHAAVKPGEVTASNAVPWQADYLACRWEEQSPYLKRLGWWPAQRPDDVFTEVDGTTMVPWARGVGTDYQDMIDKWDRLGMVVDRGDRRATLLRRD